MARSLEPITKIIIVIVGILFCGAGNAITHQKAPVTRAVIFITIYASKQNTFLFMNDSGSRRTSISNHLDMMDMVITG